MIGAACRRAWAAVFREYPSRPSPGATRASVVESQEIEKFPDLVVNLRRMAHPNCGVKLVSIPSALAGLRHVRAVNEVGDDPLGGPLGDPNGVCHFAEPRRGIALETQKHLRVAC
ncbi:MAG TPA: hypothetical protein VFU96_05985 [Acidimicrobiia bacterium]|nr:hypothetical protein [Acidimicrobiia bacterium]